MNKSWQPPRLVTTMTPLRLSLIGGGTDILDFYRQEPGAVLSTAVDKYIYVTLKQHSPLFNEQYRINYSITEHTQSLDDIENDIVRECLRIVPIDPPLYINTSADLPANSGLGSSSSFAVGLLYALHVMRGEHPSAGQLAEEACEVEIGRLKHPIGKQDQYAAAFGGLNLIQFHASGQVAISPVHMSEVQRQELFASSLTFYTGIQRSASAVLKEQRSNIGSTRHLLSAMRDDALLLREELVKGFDAAAVGQMLDRNWHRKRDLAASIGNPQINEWYATAMKAGALGGKLLGAGGGGFLYFIAALDNHAAIRQALSDLTEIPINHESRGSRVALIVP